jgi:hypothetical protein
MAQSFSARSSTLTHPMLKPMDSLGRATKSDPGAKMRSQHDSARLFFLLSGLALVMVWLNQQI